MIPQFDQATKDLIEGLTPRWTALRVEKRQFSGLDAHGFKCASILFVGQPSLLCGIDPKDFPGSKWEYFPIRCDIVDESIYGPDDVALARLGGESDLDRKLQWLFEMPSIALTEEVETFGRGEGAQRETFTFAFYNGLLITDPKGRGSLRLTANPIPGFILTAELTFGSGEA
jgi:hypothetical protein